MKELENRPDPRELVEAFVASNRSERAFTALVEHLSRLVYSSALRRTSNPQLAEEITQNVFAILARKAESLRRHPSLQAWILETTRLQAASAMRSQRRRKRKLAALTSEAEARHSAAPDTMDNSASWKEAVPFLDEALDRLPVKERKIIVQRFYEGKKFREIAAASGQTEGACKKRVKRALEKLSRMLSARGVTLSTTVVASALGTELARSAPVQSAAVLAPNALAASSSIPLTTLLANTLQTMSSFKTVTVTTSAVVAITAVPFLQQRAEADRIESELKTLAEERSAPEAEPLVGRVSRSQPVLARAARPVKPRTAESLLASLDRPIEHRGFIRDLMEVTGLPDPLAEDAAWNRVQRMNLEERKELIRALREFPMHRATKGGLAQRILDWYSELTPREQLEELILWGRSTSQSYMRDWAASEPDAAIQWFLEKRATGELDRGLGVNLDLYKGTLRDLLAGVAKESPAKVLDFYRELPEEEIDENDMRYVAGTIARGEIERGEQRYYREMLETHSGEDRKAILQGILSAHVGNGLFDEGMAVVDDYVQSPEERFEYIEGIFDTTGLPFWKFGSGLDWVLASTSEAEAPAVIRRLMQPATVTSLHSTLEWIESQEPGGVRDHAYAGWVEKNLDSAFTDDFPRVLPAAGKIEDPALRAEIRQLIRQKWNKQDKAKASQYLPADLVEQLEKL